MQAPRITFDRQLTNVRLVGANARTSAGGVPAASSATTPPAQTPVNPPPVSSPPIDDRSLAMIESVFNSLNEQVCQIEDLGGGAGGVGPDGELHAATVACDPVPSWR